jgi:hypothetical protein
MKYFFSIILKYLLLTPFFFSFQLQAQKSLILYKDGPVIELTTEGAIWRPSSCPPSDAICKSEYDVYSYIPEPWDNPNFTTNAISFRAATCNGGDKWDDTYNNLTVRTNSTHTTTVTKTKSVQGYSWVRSCRWCPNYVISVCHGEFSEVEKIVVSVVEPVRLNPMDDIRNVCKERSPIDLKNYLTDKSIGTIFLDGVALADGILDPSKVSSGVHSVYVGHLYSNGWWESPRQSVNVIQAPAVNAGEDKALCISHGIYYLTGSPKGGTWSGGTVENNTIDTRKFAPGTYGLTYKKADQYGCYASDIVDITINQLPVVNNEIPTVFCLKDQMVELAKKTPANSVWRGNGIVNINMFSPDVAGVGEWTISLETTDPSTGCTNIDSKTVKVKPNPVPILGPQISVCQGGEPIKLNNDTPLGGSYTGTGINNATSSFDPTGLAPATYPVKYKVTQDGCSSEISKNIIVKPMPELTVKQPTITVCPETNNLLLDNVLPTGGFYQNNFLISSNVFSILDAKEGIHEVIYHFVDENKCANSAKFNISIVPKVTVDAGPDFTVCEQDPETKISGQSPEGGLWTATCGNCVTDYFDSRIAGEGTYVLTYKVNYGSNCNGIDTRRVTVKPNPIIKTAELIQACKNDKPFELKEFATPEGGNWQLTNYVRNNIFYPADARSGYNLIKYTFSDPQTGCSTTESMNVSVNLVPTVYAGENIFSCLNSSPITLSGTPEDGTWIGKGVNGKLFDPKRANIGMNTLVLKKTSNTGCTGTDTLIAMVYELPHVDAGEDLKLCKNSAPVNLIASPTGGTWEGSDAIDENNVFNAEYSSQTVSTLTYTYFDPNGCWAQDKKIITIQPTPRALVNEDNIVCHETEQFNPKGGNPIGGIWVGNGTSKGIFYPKLTGIGNHPLYYVYTDINNCTDSALTFIQVLPSPKVNAGGDSTICKTIEFFDLAKYTATPKGGIWKGANTVNNIMSPAALSPGRYTLYYNYIDGNKCANNDSVNFDIEEGLETPAITGENRLCQGDTVSLEAAITEENTDTKYIWYKEGETEAFSEGKRIQFLNEKSITVFAEATNPTKKCASRRGKIDMINDTPAGIITASKSSIEKDNYVKFGFSGTGTSYKWEFGDGDYSIETSPYHYYYQLGTYSVNVQVTSEKGCKATFKADNIIQVTGKELVIVTGTTDTKTEDLNIKGYPNPVKDIFTIEIPEGEYSITITDLSGRVKESMNINGTSNINFTDYVTGTYIMQLRSADFIKSYKIQKY